MKNLIKWGLSGGIVLLLAGMLMLATSLYIDTNDFKDRLSDLVQNETGHQLEIDGQVDLQWFPPAGLRFSGVSLFAEQDSMDPPLLSATGLRLKLDWWVLLLSHIKIEDLTLNQPVVNLVIDQKGKGNWTPLLNKLSAQESGSNGSDGFTLAIQRIRLQDARVHWQDKQSGKTIELEQLNIDTGYLTPGEHAPITAKTSLSTGQPALQLDLSLRGELGANADFTQLTVTGLAIETTAHAADIQEQGMNLKLLADLSLNIPEEYFQLDDLSIAAAGARITGAVEGKGFNGLSWLKGELVMQEANPKAWLAGMGIAVDTADSEALTRVRMATGLKLEDEWLFLYPISIQLDDSLITGQAQIRPGEKLQMNGQLSIDRLDLNRYLVDAGVGNGAGFQLSPNVEALRKLQLDAKLAIDQLTLNGLNLQRVNMKLQSSEDAILLKH